VRIVIKDLKTPDGQEPAFIGPNGVGAPVLFSAVVGRTTEVTIVNDSQESHIFDLTSLGVNTLQIAPGPSTVHFSIDPTSRGEACELPVTWDHLTAGSASGMGPPPLPVMGPPEGPPPPA
jgi:hypothetical protein